MAVAGLLGRALLGGTAAAAEGIYQQHTEDLKQKRAAAMEKIRQDFYVQRDESQRSYETEQDEKRYQRGRTDAASDYERDRAAQLSDTAAKQAHELKLAGMRAKSGSASAKLNPLIAEQIKGIDNELEGYYKAQAEGLLQPEQQQRLQWLQQQRTFLLGGGFGAPAGTPDAAPAAGEGDAGGVAEEAPKPASLNEQFRSQQRDARQDERQQQQMQGYSQALTDIESNLEQITGMPMAPSVPVLQGGLLRSQPKGSKQKFLNQLDEIARHGDDSMKAKAAELYGRITQP